MKQILLAVLLIMGTGVVAQQKVAYISSEELLAAMPEMKAAETSLQSFQKQKQTELEQMDAELQRKINLYQEKYQTLSEANRTVVEKELDALANEATEIKKRIEDVDQKASQEFRLKQEELFSPVLQKANTAVQRIAKEKGYAYVFDISQPGVIFYEGDDLLPLVKERLGLSAETAAK